MMLRDFGSDLACATDLDPLMRELYDDDPRLVAESCIRRLQTPRGALMDDPDYGYDLRLVLRSAAYPNKLGALPSLIRAELSKDDRVESLDIKAHFSQDVRAQTIELTIYGTTAVGPFTLTGSLSSETLRLEIIS